MTVFRCQMKIARRNIGTIIMYFAIFIGISIAIQKSETASNKSVGVFSDYALKLGVVDRDNSDVSEGIIKFLSKAHEVNVLEDDIGVLRESLYYLESDVIIQFPKGLKENLGTEYVKIDITEETSNNNYYMYIQSQINDVINCIKTYMAAGYSAEEALEKLSLQEDSKVSLIDVNGNGGEVPAYSYMFRFFPYICIAILGSVIGLMFMCIRKKDIRKRMEASAISLKRQNFENILACIFIGVIIWAAFLIVIVMFNGKEIIGDENFIYYILNSFAMMIIALSMAFVVGMIANSPERVNIIVTPLSLSICFLGGVFVPLSVLNDTVRKIAKFVPAYWYEEINNNLANYASLPNDIVWKVWCGIGIQFLFAAAFLGSALAISKYKKQF